MTINLITWPIHLCSTIVLRDLSRSDRLVDGRVQAHVVGRVDASIALSSWSGRSGLRIRDHTKVPTQSLILRDDHAAVHADVSRVVAESRIGEIKFCTFMFLLQQNLLRQGTLRQARVKVSKIRYIINSLTPSPENTHFVRGNITVRLTSCLTG